MTLLVRRAALLVALLAGLSLLAPSSAPVPGSGPAPVVAAVDTETGAPAPDRAWSPGVLATALPVGAADAVVAAPVPALALHLQAVPVVRPPSDGRPQAGPQADRGRGPPVPSGT